ncbi:MAG: EamA family transporter RarD [Proteobacteria bacterium]|nr:EamA family transporter RarD [Pseudomonadota bacterium]
MSAHGQTRRGFLAATTAFVGWGLLPLYLHALQRVPVLQVVSHRVLWSCAVVLVWLGLRGELGVLLSILARPALWTRLLLSSVLISVNWLTYVWAVAHGHTVDASLGYYIGPLVNVLLGVMVLRERLSAAQWLAVALAAAGVIILTLRVGHLPWIALVLAVSFSLYGLVRKTISVAALPGLATETLLLLAPTVAYLAWGLHRGADAFTSMGAGIAALLIGSGIFTAMTLFLFAWGARALPYSVLGVMQYIAPTLQFACGVLFLHEPFGADRAAGFGMVWLALAIFAADGLLRSYGGPAVTAWRAKRTRRFACRCGWTRPR